ncbi:MAG: EVE domain-containing protein, partial [Candidatus Cloacimonetes bacterium]|nr:EVE domain-containing protein [Candidatus Cloacimonadota bacterium]
MPVEPTIKMPKEQVLAADGADPLKALIRRYKLILQGKGLADELYKWKLVKQHIHKLDTSAIDFIPGLISVLGNNLFYYMPVAAAKELAKEKPHEYRQCYVDLFDENLPLAQRTVTFTKAVDALYHSLGHENLAHHDERTISNLLTFHDPTTYTFFKDSYYQKYCKLIKEEPRKVGSKYPHYLSLMKGFIDNYINVDTELIALVNSKLSDDSYRDPNRMILAQDILYQALGDEIIDDPVGINYWLFQCNPEYYDIVGALNKGLPIKWRVMAHKDKIHSKDKVILWVTGAEAGCYALAEVTSEVELTTSDYWEQDFRKDDSLVQPGNMVEITITTNLADRPILKPQLAGIKGLEGLNAGLQGTNFKATKKQYEALEKLATDKGNTIQNDKEDLVRDYTNEDHICANHPLNQILFGPPGTGKTYNSINIAVKIA